MKFLIPRLILYQRRVGQAARDHRCLPLALERAANTVDTVFQPSVCYEYNLINGQPKKTSPKMCTIFTHFRENRNLPYHCNPSFSRYPV
jgi:hypothetical protein